MSVVESWRECPVNIVPLITSWRESPVDVNRNTSWRECHVSVIAPQTQVWRECEVYVAPALAVSVFWNLGN